MVPHLYGSLAGAGEENCSSTVTVGGTSYNFKGFNEMALSFGCQTGCYYSNPSKFGPDDICFGICRTWDQEKCFKSSGQLVTIIFAF